MAKESTEFYKFISNWLRKTTQEIDRNHFQLTREELSESMGIKWTSLHKVLNLSRKETATRDYIIAVCSQLRLNDEETNKALNLYGFPVLVGNTFKDGEIEKYFARDDLLINILYDIENEKDTIDEINLKLMSANFPKLNIPGRIEKNTIEPPYIISDIKNRLYVSSSYFDQYNSLETVNSIDTYTCYSYMFIKRKEDEAVFKLVYKRNSKYSIYKVEKGELDYLSVKHFKKPTESNEYKPYFSMLKSSNNVAIKNLKSKLNDTKNFKERISASFVNNQLRVFTEAYNFSLPELNEYLFVNYSDGKYEYKLYEDSMFLKYSLKEEKYIHEFKAKNIEPEFETNNFDEIEKKYLEYSLKKHDVGEYIVKDIVAQYQKLKTNLESFISYIKNKKRYIRNARYIFEENIEYNICCYMGLVDFFNFDLVDSEYGIYELVSHEFSYKDVIITFDDVENAFELGMDGIDEIYAAKKKYESIENILKSL